MYVWMYTNDKQRIAQSAASRVEYFSKVERTQNLNCVWEFTWMCKLGSNEGWTHVP